MPKKDPLSKTIWRPADFVQIKRFERRTGWCLDHKPSPSALSTHEPNSEPYSLRLDNSPLPLMIPDRRNKLCFFWREPWAGTGVAIGWKYL
jgi:hypothetical protein